MKRYIKYYTLALCFSWWFGLASSSLQAQCTWLQVQIGQNLAGNTLSVYVKPNLDVNSLPCTIWSTGSQITIRWPQVASANPVSATTFNATAMGFSQNVGIGPNGAIGADGGDGYYYIQFTNDGIGTQALLSSGNQEIFNVVFTASSTPAFEFVQTGVSTVFGNTDPAIFMGGQNVFGNFVPSGPFPVEWTHFSARSIYGREVELSWGTSVEINNDYFQIEKSVDGQVFESITKINGKGNSSEKQEYNYVDKQYVADLVDYRLKQVDKNGLFEYSKVEQVNLEHVLLSQLRFEVSPNPAHDKVSFKLLGKATGEEEPILIDTFGKKVYNENFDLGKGELSLSVANLSEGMYYAFILSKDGKQYPVGRFLKQ